MGVGLQPLEFTECLADSPAFRENLQRHEKELERTSQQIKRLIKEVKDVVQAAKRLGDAQKALATSMEQFEFACIGASQTEDERVIGRSLHHFAHLIRTIEEERERMLGRAHEQIIQPLEKFRKEHIGAVKEGKKKFDKKTAKFCQSQERTLSLSVRKPETVFQEADAALDMAERDFCQASLEYVFQLQAVQERKKFELVETLLGFVFGWWTFHHTAHDVHADAEPRVRDLQLRIQRTRSNFEETSKQTESLMKKMMEVRQQSKEGEASDEAGGRSGYLFLQEKKAFGTTWSKQYAVYSRGSRLLQLQPYSQLCVKAAAAPDAVPLAGARPPPEPIERRFCWEALPADRERPPLLLQVCGVGARARGVAARRAARPRPPRARRRRPRPRPRLPRAARRPARRARRRRLQLRAPHHTGARGARARGTGPVPRGGRGQQDGAAGGGGGGRPRARHAVVAARVGVAHAHVGAQGVPAGAARPPAVAAAAQAAHTGRQAGAAQRARVGAARAGARAAARAPGHAAAGAGAPAERGGAQRPQPDDAQQPGGVLRAHAAARRHRLRGLHPRAQVLQRARRDAAGPLPGHLRGAGPAARRGPAAAAAAAVAATAAAAAQWHDQDIPDGAAAALPHGPHQYCGGALPRGAPAAAGGAAAGLQQQQRRLRVVVRAAAAAAGPAGGPGAARGPRAHAVRLPGRERGRAVVRAQPDPDQRDAVAGARLAAGHAQRPHRPRARELRGAAALSPRPAPFVILLFLLLICIFCTL